MAKTMRPPLLRNLITALAVGFLDEPTSGHRWCCRVHPDWKVSSSTVVARTVDLRSAYKQLPVSEQDLPVAITCMYHPRIQHAVFYCNASSRGLEVVMCMVGGLLASSYFDDFP
eukprot:719786-Amphidinium_carterae.1